MKCARCGKEINKAVPDFYLNTETYKMGMQFICEECENKRYEKLKEIFDGKSSSIHDK